MSLFVKEKLKILTLWAFVLCKGISYAQPTAFDPYVPIKNLVMNQWTNESGLRSNNLTSVYQSSDGYLWVTSYNGIHKFDGVSFKVFDKKNTTQLATSSVFSNYEDANGVVWFSTEASGVIGNKNGVFFSLIKRDSLPKAVLVSTIDAQGTTWLGTKNLGLVAITKKSKIFKPEGIPKISINHLNIDQKERLYTATDGDGLYILNGANIRHLTTKDGLLSDIVNCTFSHERMIYVGTINGLNVWDGNQLKIIEQFNGLEINQITIDSFGTIWAATENGLARYNKVAKIFELFTVKNGLPGKQVSGLSFDNEGSLWLVTRKAGLIRFKQGNIKNLTSADGLSSNRVNVIAKNNLDYYIGTDDGLINVLKGGKIEQINLGNQFHEAGVRDFLFQDNGDWWVASYDGVAHIMNGRTYFYNETNGLPSTAIRRIFEDSNNNIWLGSRVSGLIKFDVSGRNQHVVYDRNKGLGSDYVMSIEEDNYGNIVIGTNAGGLNILDSNGEMKVFHIKEDDTGTLIFNTFIDHNNTIWLCTNAGLFVFGNQKFKKVEIDELLLTEAFFDLIDDKKGNYWLTTNLGVVKLSWKTLDLFLKGEIEKVDFELHDKDYGIANNECTGATKSFYDNETGRIWVPTFGGVAIIDPGIELRNNKVPPIYITDFIIDDNRFSSLDDNLKVDFRAFRYTFNFSALSYLTPSKVKFMYKLEGFDEDWIGPVSERTVQYTNLPASEFRFLVKGSNGQGVWNKTETSFSFEVLPQFHKTIWFYLLAMVLVMLILYSVYKWRLGDITKRNDALKKINDELDKFVYSASHDLRAPLASIMGLVNLMKKDRNEAERQEYIGLISECANKMDVFIDDIIDYSRNKNRSLTIDKIKIEELINESYDALKYLNLEAKVHQEVKVLGLKFINNDKRRLKVILSNLIANAINYSDKTKAKSFVRINVKAERDTVEFKITDNGIGIPEKEVQKIFTMFYRADEKSKGSGLGLYIVKETLQKLNGTISVESKLGKWTSFTFVVPNVSIKA